MNPRGQNKKMKSIVVEEQEQKEGSESGFVDLDEDTLHNVLKRVDEFTLASAECVNKLWREVATDERLWEPIAIRLRISRGGLESIDEMRNIIRRIGFHRYVHDLFLSHLVDPPPADFNSIDFSKKIGAWVQNKGKISLVEPPPSEFYSIDFSKNIRSSVQNKDKISFQFPIPRMWRIAVADDFGDVCSYRMQFDARSCFMFVLKGSC